MTPSHLEVFDDLDHDDLLKIDTFGHGSWTGHFRRFERDSDGAYCIVVEDFLTAGHEVWLPTTMLLNVTRIARRGWMDPK